MLEWSKEGKLGERSQILSRQAEGVDKEIFPDFNARESGSHDFEMGVQLARKSAAKRAAAAAELAYLTGAERLVKEAEFDTHTNKLNQLLAEFEPKKDRIYNA